MKKIMEWVKEHKYCYSFLYLILYLLAFFLMEQISEPQYLIHSNLDDKIPFNSYFLIFMLAGILLCRISNLFLCSMIKRITRI